MIRDLLIASAINVNPVSPFVLGDVAGPIGRSEKIVERALRRIDHNQPDAGTDSK